MKRIIVCLIAVTLLLCACSGSEATTPAKKDFDGSAYSDTGAGTFYLINESGTTENGNTITVYADKNTTVTSIGADAFGFDGSVLSHIYIDGMEHSKEQLAESQITITLEKETLAPGTHTVECVQFENDDVNGTVITYKSGQYEVVEK